MSNISNDEENINVNIEENNENKINEEVSNEKINESTNEETTNKEMTKEIAREEITEVENKNTEGVNNKVSFKDAFSSISVDILITAALSVVGIILFDVILRVAAGYYVKEKASVFLIIYLIMTLLYTSIMESSKGNTIGKRLAKLKLTKME